MRSFTMHRQALSLSYGTGGVYSLIAVYMCTGRHDGGRVVINADLLPGGVWHATNHVFLSLPGWEGIQSAADLFVYDEEG